MYTYDTVLARHAAAQAAAARLATSSQYGDDLRGAVRLLVIWLALALGLGVALVRRRAARERRAARQGFPVQTEHKPSRATAPPQPPQDEPPRDLRAGDAAGYPVQWA